MLRSWIAESDVSEIHLLKKSQKFSPKSVIADQSVIRGWFGPSMYTGLTDPWQIQ